MVKKPYSFLFKMGRRNIRHHYGQYLAIIMIAAIAVTLFVGLQANASSLESRVNSFYEDGNVADVYLGSTGTKQLDIESMKEEVKDKADVEGRFYYFSRLRNTNCYTSITPSLPTISKPVKTYNDSSSSDKFFYVDKALIKDDKENLSGFEIGTAYDLEFDFSSFSSISSVASMLDGYLKEGKTNFLKKGSFSINVTISGSMEYPENVCKASYNASVMLLSSSLFHQKFLDLCNETFNSEGVDGIFSGLYLLLGWGDGTTSGGVSSFPKANQALFRCKNSSADEIKKTLTDAYAPDYCFARSEMPYDLTMQNDVSQARSFCYVFPFVFFFTALLVILTTISQLIIRERLQIGTMKALGLSKSEIYWHYIGITLILVGLGTLIGEIVGPLLIPSIMDIKYSIIYTIPSLSYSFPVLVGLLTAFLFLALSSFVTFIVCRKEVKLKPSESMRPSSPRVSFKPKERKKPGKSLLLSIKMAFRNIALDPLKSIMVVIGVAGCTALLACGYGIDDTLDYGISHDLDMASSADISVTFNAGLAKNAIIEKLSSVSGVENVEPYSRSSSTAKIGSRETTTYLYILSSDYSTHFKVNDFADNEVAVSQKVAEKLSLSVGSSFSFTNGTATFEGKVGQIYSAFAYHGVIVRHNNPIFEGQEPKYLGAFVDVLSGQDVKTVSDEIKSKNPEVSDTMSQNDWKDRINNIIGGVKYMTMAVKVFAILLALVVLYNLALLNFKERSRDIATMKVLGFNRIEIASSLLYESMSLTGVGVAIGLALGSPFLYAVLGQNSVDLVTYLFMIYPTSYIISFALTFVVALGVNVFLAFKTNKIQMVDSLKSVE